MALRRPMTMMTMISAEVMAVAQAACFQADKSAA
jgi:hypothetical protein